MSDANTQNGSPLDSRGAVSPAPDEPSEVEVVNGINVPVIKSVLVYYPKEEGVDLPVDTTKAVDDFFVVPNRCRREGARGTGITL